MNRLLVVGILIFSTVPLFAQGKRPDPAKLKTEAQKVVSIISGDEGKTQTYCEASDIAKQMLQAEHTTLDVKGATKSQIERAMQGHVLANAELMGTYQKGDR